VALVGDPTRARKRLGWTPERSFEDLVAEMVTADLAALRR
jgi:GDPmannose 4,6-dehydratase